MVRANLDGLEMILVRYPDLLEGSFAVIAANPTTGLYETHVGLIITDTPVCHAGYEGTDRRSPANVEDRELNKDARCTEPPTMSNPRGTQNLPRVQPNLGTFDSTTGRFRWGATTSAPPRDVAAPPLGDDSWKWLYLEPLLGR